jgi:Ca2+:H+ antiporter
VECTPNLARKLGAIHDVGAAWEDEEQKLRMGSKMAIALLIVVTVNVAITAGFLVDSLDDLTSSGYISKEFLGFILLPVVGNGAGKTLHIPSTQFRCF